MKNMVKRVGSVLLAVLMLASCGKGVGTDTRYTPAQIAEAIITAQGAAASGEDATIYESLIPGDEFFEHYILNVYQLDADSIKDGAIYYSGIMVAEEIAIFLLGDDSEVKAAKDALTAYKQRRAEAFTGYAPEQAAKLENGIVVTHGSYAALLVCEDPQSAQSVFMECFGGDGQRSGDDGQGSGSRDQGSDGGETDGVGDGQGSGDDGQGSGVRDQGSDGDGQVSDGGEIDGVGDGQGAEDGGQSSDGGETGGGAGDGQGSDGGGQALDGGETGDGVGNGQGSGDKGQGSDGDGGAANGGGASGNGASDNGDANNGVPSDGASNGYNSGNGTSDNGTSGNAAADHEDAYNPVAILNAWNSGDKSGLSYKNRSILDACIDIIAALTHENMSQYEMELAIHDWIIDWVNYDVETMSNLPTAKPDPDNDNPYGAIFRQKAICSGYTSTFQLFMDMLGIECISVNGTYTSLNAEHAWNMVRIDGEWYCVDVTWNDPIGGSQSALTRYKYFNVTSQYMRETNHQWDESATPTADAGKLFFE